MLEAITLDKLCVDCNIGQFQIQNLTISSHIGNHATAIIDAIISSDKAGFSSCDLGGQPLSVHVNNFENKLLFYGIIFEAIEYWKANFLSLRITAYSLSWLLDLEKKSRSFQKVDSTYAMIINSILDEYGGCAIFNFEDKPIEKPYIQYNETDWTFLRRISSQLKTPVIPSIRPEYPELYIGLPTKEKSETLECSLYRFGVDEDFIRHRSERKGQYVYYEIEGDSPRKIGDIILFKGRTWYVSEVNARICKGILRFTCRLTGLEYSKVLPAYNSELRGLSITGTVLERQGEKLRVHLDIDEEQSVKHAYFYTWLPETSNIMYNMPPVGTRVSLHMQNNDEHSAICIQNVRENGDVCAFTQDPNHRFLTTELQKSFSKKPRTMELTNMESGDVVLLDDDFGFQFCSGKEMLIKADGKITVSSTTVNMKAPQEITTVRRDVVSPTVMNLCNNVDTAGGKGKFQATGKTLVSPEESKSERISYQYNSGEATKGAEQEKRKKMNFEMSELIRQADKNSRYDITDIFQTVLGAVPQQPFTDECAGLSAGSRVLFGNVEGFTHVSIGKQRGYWDKSGNQSDQLSLSGEKIIDNNKEDGTDNLSKGNTCPEG